ncbi:MAG: chemotaxis protein CheA, partial [Deltaproteobacteria bacterium]|nr:chemotaxis protein CheA [Deltaproteobacteria bacterium]
MATDSNMDFSRFLEDYLDDSREGFQTINNVLLALEKDHGNIALLDDIFRVLHTLKSSSTMLGFSDIVELTHISEGFLALMRTKKVAVGMETLALLFSVVDTLEGMLREHAGRGGGVDWGARLAELKQRMGAQSEKTADVSSGQPRPPVGQAGVPAIEEMRSIRIKADLLDLLFNQVGELIILKNRIDTLVSGNADKELKSVLAAMRRVINGLQDNVTVARMVPVAEIFEKFPRMMRDLALERGKEVDLVLEGRDIELDKGILDAIGEPLLHLLRNAVAHGIESPEERRKNNKAACGSVRLAARRLENQILIEVEDDGCGIDTARILAAAREKGLLKREETDVSPEKDVMRLLFDLEISTAGEVTGLSGRGMGLRIVKTSVRELGGTVEVETQRGRGTRFVLRLPLTTAIMQMLMVSVGGHIFGIPADIVHETLETKAASIQAAAGGQVLILRNEVIPYVRLNEALNIQEESENLIALIVRRGNKFMGVGVDAVLNEMENIVKPFDLIAQQFKGFSGGMILGDGRVALLLDMPTLLGFETVKEHSYEK